MHSISIVLSFLGSLALLLYGMDILSSGLQKGAGGKLEKLLKIISGNRFTAVLTGLLVTSVIQSSSATTVMVVSFVNAKIITLFQAIGIIFGSNIGTTMTAWLVSLFGFSLNISSFCIPLFGIGFFLKMMKKWKIHDAGNVFMGFALLFMGLKLLGEVMKLDKNALDFVNSLSDKGFIGVFFALCIGAFFTALLNSSSAMTAIILTLAHSSQISWELSAALVLGSNIGTTTNALYAALHASAAAKRAALIHLMFNVTASVFALIFFHPFINFIDFITPRPPQENITNHIAMLHTVFNVFATLIFLPFVGQIEKLFTFLVKSKEEEEEGAYTLPLVQGKTGASAEMNIVYMKKEIEDMASYIMKMMEKVKDAMSENEDGEVALSYLIKKEEYIDDMYEEITAFLIATSRLESSTTATRSEIAQLIRITDELEGVSDQCLAIMHSLYKFLMKRAGGSKESREKLTKYMQKLCDFFATSIDKVSEPYSLMAKKRAKDTEEEMDRGDKELRKEARKRIEKGSDVKSELQYIDIAHRIEKAADRVYAIINS